MPIKRYPKPYPTLRDLACYLHEEQRADTFNHFIEVFDDNISLTNVTLLNDISRSTVLINTLASLVSSIDTRERSGAMDDDDCESFPTLSSLEDEFRSYDIGGS